MVQETKADVYIDGERNKLVLIRWHCWKKNKTCIFRISGERESGVDMDGIYNR